MSDEPYFPPPGPRASESNIAPLPYRTPPVAERSQPLQRVNHGTSPENGVVARRIEELAQMRSRRIRDGAVQIGVGLALLVGGVVVTLSSGGHVFWLGAAFAGVLSVLRGAMHLLGVTART